MDATTLAWILVLIFSCIGAALSWKSPTCYLCILNALISLVALVPGGPW